MDSEIRTMLPCRLCGTVPDNKRILSFRHHNDRSEIEQVSYTVVCGTCRASASQEWSEPVAVSKWNQLMAD